MKICALSERYRNRMASIFEIQKLFGSIAFPWSSVLHKIFVGCGPRCGAAKRRVWVVLRVTLYTW